jgi:hypothetical protein
VGRPALSLALVVLLSACVGRQVRRRDPVSRQLRALDAKFDARADPVKLDAALQGYLALDARHPDDPRVLARLSEAFVVQGMADPAQAAGAWQVAREWGIRCILLGSAVSGRVQSAGGRLTPAAAKLVPAVHANCALWAAAAWARQSEARGAGGVALDLPVIAQLARRAQELSTPNQEAGAAEDVLGLALSLPPDAYEPPLAEAQTWLEAAGREAPASLLYRVDLAGAILIRNGQVGAARVLLAGVRDATEPEGGWRPEDRWALARAAELLETLNAH